MHCRQARLRARAQCKGQVPRRRRRSFDGQPRCSPRLASRDARLVACAAAAGTPPLRPAAETGWLGWRASKMPERGKRHRVCGLTLRSSGAPTAGHQARSGGTRYIFASPGLASRRCRPLSSNVRPHVPSAVQVVALQIPACAAPRPAQVPPPDCGSLARQMRKPNPSSSAARLRPAAALSDATRCARRSPCCVRRGGGYATSAFAGAA